MVDVKKLSSQLAKSKQRHLSQRQLEGKPLGPYWGQAPYPTSVATNLAEANLDCCMSPQLSARRPWVSARLGSGAS